TSRAGKTPRHGWHWPGRMPNPVSSTRRCDGPRRRSKTPSSQRHTATRHASDYSFTGRGSRTGCRRSENGWAFAAAAGDSDPVSSRAQEQVHDPAPPDVWPRTPTVGEDVVAVAPGVLPGVRQDGHGDEVPRLVH